MSEASANVGVDILAKVGIDELPTGDILARNEEATVQGELFPSAEIALVNFSEVQPQLEVALQDKRLDFDRVRPYQRLAWVRRLILTLPQLLPRLLGCNRRV